MDPRSGITPWDLECMLCDEMAEPKALPLSLLEEITGGFCDEQQIGSGGFAVVYKGMLENRIVAVKRMSNTYMYEKEFQREVECLMMVKHKNVVRFLGYCADTQGAMARHEGKFIMADVQQRLLCFEYIPKGSLHEYISDTTRELRWRDRYQIIKGICQGLQYLHQKNILHLDLKPANILLDDSWVPKITDFGISRCFDQMQSQVITNIAGTPGYLAPESFNHTEVTYRNSYRLDIYSLGVVIIEILTGKKGYHDVDKVVESWSDMFEESHRDVQMEQVRLCAEIGIECTNFDPTKRPDTQNIISRLGEIESLDGYIETGQRTSLLNNPYMSTGTTHTLWLTYQRLNPDIKRCLEYCSIFPRESKLRRNQLVRLWIAQRFVKTSCATEDMEDVAEGYIRELVSFSFLQPEETSDGEGCFTIDSVLHDLLDKVARNCFRIENARGLWEREEWEGDVARDIQHLLIQNYDAKLITEMIPRLENLRTLIVYVVEEQTNVEEEVIQSICKSLTKLRVLAISFSVEYNPIKYPVITFLVPKSIKQLKNLRYLAFRWSSTFILPTTLNKLHHIQFLDFSDNNTSKFDLHDLVNLRGIFSLSKNFSNIGRLISLQTVPPFEVRNEQGHEVKQLRSLNKLRGTLMIVGLEYVESKEEALEANIGAKERLTGLILVWSVCVDTSYSQETEEGVLEGLCPPVGLKKLIIARYRGLRYPDWMVGKDNSGPKGLQQLRLSECRPLRHASELARAFPHLLLLEIRSCDWDALPGNMEHLKSLKELQIYECKNIRSLPTLPQSLEKFHIQYCDNQFMKSCQTVGHPNWQKIEHIPDKILGKSATTEDPVATAGLVATADPVATASKQNKILSCINRLRCF